MHLMMVVIFAFLTKPFILSPVGKGDKGFFMTYFVYGGVACFIFMFLFVGYFSGMFAGNPDDFNLRGVLKSAMTIMSFYFIVIAIALYNIAVRPGGFGKKIVCYFFIPVLLIPSLIGIIMSFFSSLIYLIALYLVNRFVWKWDMIDYLKRIRTAR
ncbi:hypothetical protein EDF81_0591 [Enterobacter sp. BIGb0383]|uniref:hypothetical protein n=1 Tax=unclassified Enterobacter TaxID=2608935 RepID=UPI000F49887F|nr:MULTISPECIES: hypothetical protein [unclassified Enterobacter]ROP62109.1 hypothetical protein EDF81_0591 [Enterobacter sp. BIGb0383]ROS12271.1 hypothetical protein EC848_0593 [Enterobacter sp. BIGb0359]